jgi:hypothetical protein
MLVAMPSIQKSSSIGSVWGTHTNAWLASVFGSTIPEIGEIDSSIRNLIRSDAIIATKGKQFARAKTKNQEHSISRSPPLITSSNRAIS